MTEQKFKSEMRRAETMRGLADPQMQHIETTTKRSVLRYYPADRDSIAAEAVGEALSKMADELHENSDGFLTDLREDIEFTTDVGDALIPAYISDRFWWRDVEHEIEIFLKLAEFVERSKYRLVYEAEIYWKWKVNYSRQLRLCGKR